MMPTIHRSSASLLTESRLDPYFYDPLFVSHAALMRSRFSRLTSLGELFHVLDGTHDGVPTQDERDENFCIPFLRAQDIGTGSMRRCDGAFLSLSDHLVKCKRSQIKRGDVLLNIMATTGEACFYSNACPETANANRAVGILRAKTQGVSDAYKRTLCILLSSKLGNRELARQLKGSIQQRLNLEDIAECCFPILEDSVQQYISDKVRQAEDLRNWAAAFLNSAIGLLEELIAQRLTVADAQQLFLLGSDNLHLAASRINGHVDALSAKWPVVPERRTSTVPIKTLTSRLDASYYTIKAITNEKLLKSLGSVNLRSLIATEKSGYGVLPDSNDYVCIGKNTIPLIRGGDLSFGGINPPEVFVPSNLVTDRAITRVNDVLILIKGACIDQAEGVGIVGARDANRLFNGSCYRITAKEVDPNYLVAYFQSSAFLIQKRREIANTGISYNSEESIHQYLVPRFSPILEKLIADLVQKSLAMRQFAEALTRSGKHLVEGLIEGQFSESEFTDAQRALENGDPSKDWAILSRMNEAGIQVEDSNPLFTDPDALFEAIQESQTPLPQIGDAV
jgi:type I restriction enzyme S subunit